MIERSVVFLVLLVTRSLPAAAQEDLLPPQIVHEPCDYYQKNKPFRVVALFYDDSAIFDPKVIYRSAKIENWRSVSFQKAEGRDEFVAEIPARHLRGTLEYFIETFDENGNGPARFGSPEASMRLRPSARAPDCMQIPEAAAVVAPAESSQPPVPAGPAVDVPPDEGAPTDEGSPAAPPIEPARRSVMTTKVPPAKTGCAAPDPPAYCSPLLWTLVGVGVAGAATGGVLAWCFMGGPCLGDGGTQVTIEVGSGDLNDAFGLSR